MQPGLETALLDYKCRLQHLSLAHNALAARGALGLPQVVAALAANIGITSINLSHTRLAAESACILASALATNTHLAHLDVGGNALGFFGGRALLRTQLLPDGSVRALCLDGCTFHGDPVEKPSQQLFDAGNCEYAEYPLRVLRVPRASTHRSPCEYSEQPP